MSKALPLAVFDWNGTLLDDVDAWVKGCNAALSIFGQAARSVDEWRGLYTCPIIHSYEKAGVSIDEYLQKSDEANAAFFGAYQAASADGFTLRPYAREALSALKAQGFHLTILSNHRGDLLLQEIEATGLRDMFEHICGNVSDNDITHKLTKQDRLRRYMDEVGADLSRSFVIGDSHEEPSVARALNIKSIAITGGYLSKERLIKARPTVLIDHLNQIDTLLLSS
jgi:phosphoglycolate phosphatase-like HAD superfamily hydrolase